MAPINGQWSVAPVDAPVVEAEIDSLFREALTTALATRGALDTRAPALRATVTEATWAPSRRAAGVLLYEARLTVRVEAGERVVTRTRMWAAVDAGNAAGSRAAREDTFRSLARLLAEDVIASVQGGG